MSVARTGGRCRRRAPSAAAQTLPRQRAMAGCFASADALHCQKSVAREIIEADADIFLAIKGNLSTAHHETRTFLDDAILQDALPAHRTVEKGRRRIETRNCWQSDGLYWHFDRSEWTARPKASVCGDHPGFRWQDLHRAALPPDKPLPATTPSSPRPSAAAGLSRPSATGATRSSSKKTAPAPVDATAHPDLCRRLALNLLSTRGDTRKSWSSGASFQRDLRLEKLH